MMTKRTTAALGIPTRWSGLVLPALLLSFGCEGGATGDVSGKVTYHDKPLPAGTVTFFGSEDKVLGSSVISADGDYAMNKVPIGPVRITVTAPATVRDPSASPPSKGGRKKYKEDLEKKKKGRNLKEEMKGLIRLDVPTKYSIPDQSGLTYTVQPGKQEHLLDLK